MPTEMPQDVADALATPFGQAFKRLFNDETFAGGVADDPETALADYDLTDEERESIITDAEALEGEVSGFAFGRVRDPLEMVNVLGGMRSPMKMGMSPTRLGWTGCLTCI